MPIELLRLFSSLREPFMLHLRSSKFQQISPSENQLTAISQTLLLRFRYLYSLETNECKVINDQAESRQHLNQEASTFNLEQFFLYKA